jgi:uncharacterized protein (TIGR03437 family)
MRTLALLAAVALSSGAAEFTTYIGDANDYRVARVLADAAGNTYIAGSRIVVPSQNAFFLQFAESFVMKVDSAGKIVLFTVFSGKGVDGIGDMAVDSAGNIYVAGATSSVNLPVHNALQSTPGPGFIVKFNLDATQMIYSTYFPGAIAALAVDGAGNVYVTGSTNVTNFPVTAGLPAGSVGGGVPIVFGAFLTKISPAGDKILYSTVIAGHGKDCGSGSSCFLSERFTAGVAVAVDAASSAYIAGNTDTNDLPATTGAFLEHGTGAFVAKVNAAGTALAYLTLIGARNYILTPINNPANSAAALAVDAAGNAYLAGSTSDPKFPATAGAYQPTFAGPANPPVYPPPPPDAFVAKLNPAGSAMVWATFVGGKDVDRANAVAVDGSGSVWVTGTTASTDFPNAQGWSQGSDFVVGLSATGSALPYAARFPNDTVAQSIAMDGAGTLHVAGSTGMVSTIVPSQKPTMRIFGIANAAYGPLSGRVAPGEVISIYGPHIGPATAATATPDSSGFMPKSLAGVQVFFNDSAIPLLYVSDSQINAVLPLANASGPVPGAVFSSAPPRIRVSSSGMTSTDFPVTTISSQPQIFQNADGTAKAVNQDGILNSADHPAKAGSIVSIWATGAGITPIFSLGADGQIATSAEDLQCCAVYLGNTPLSVLYAGAAPGIVMGVVQINFQLPVQIAAPSVSIFADGRFSSPVQIYVQ